MHIIHTYVLSCAREANRRDRWAPWNLVSVCMSLLPTSGKWQTHLHIQFSTRHEQDVVRGWVQSPSPQLDKTLSVQDTFLNNQYYSRQRTTCILPKWAAISTLQMGPSGDLMWAKRKKIRKFREKATLRPNKLFFRELWSMQYHHNVKCIKLSEWGSCFQSGEVLKISMVNFALRKSPDPSPPPPKNLLLKREQVEIC